MRLEPRDSVNLGWQIGAPLLAVIASMALCSGLILWAGASPLSAWGLLLKGALGSTFALTETLTRATPLDREAASASRRDFSSVIVAMSTSCNSTPQTCAVPDCAPHG